VEETTEFEHEMSGIGLLNEKPLHASLKEWYAQPGDRFEEPADWQGFLPEQLGEPFTAKDLAETIGIKRPLAQKMAYCLCKAKVIRLMGKRGRANLYAAAGA
jgi:hypothetical protein